MKMARKLYVPLIRLLSSDPPLYAFWIGLHNIVIKIRSKVQSWIFHAPGLHLGPGSVVRGSKFISFGRNVYAHGHLWIEAVVEYRNQQFNPRITIADEVSFSEGVHITCIDRISIGKSVLFGSHVYVSDHNHGSYKGPSQSHPEYPPSHRLLSGGGPVEIGECVWIGDNAVIVGPVRIGCGSIVAANSVVRADVLRHTMVGGIPAKILRRFNEATEEWEKITRSTSKTTDRE